MPKIPAAVHIRSLAETENNDFPSIPIFPFEGSSTFPRTLIFIRFFITIRITAEETYLINPGDISYKPLKTMEDQSDKMLPEDSLLFLQ
jgi:hypothetical protein